MSILPTLSGSVINHTWITNLSWLNLGYETLLIMFMPAIYLDQQARLLAFPNILAGVRGKSAGFKREKSNYRLKQLSRLLIYYPRKFHRLAYSLTPPKAKMKLRFREP